MVGGNHGTVVHRVTGYGECRQLNVRYADVAHHNVRGTERRKTVVVGKVYHVVVGMQSHTVYVFLAVQPAALDIADEPFATAVKLPETHGRRAPDVAIGRLHDVAYCLVLQHFTVRERNRFLSTGLVYIQALDGADQDGAVLHFAQRQTGHFLEQLHPPVRTETLGARVETGHAAGCCQPDVVVAVGHHGHHPVVAHPAFAGSLLADMVVADLVGGRIVDAETTGVGGDIDVAGIVAGHVVELVTLEGETSLGTARLRIIGVEGVVRSYPVASAVVTVDNLGIERTDRCADDASLLVEAEHAVALDGDPHHAAVTLADGGDG